MRSASTGGVAIDARCLQDLNYADRGVGRHTVNLLRHAPRGPGCQLIGICDPQMPALAQDALGLFDAVAPNALAAAAFSPACLISPSPMTHDPLFMARLLNVRTICRAAIIYDFIPFELPDRYLLQQTDRHAYFTRLNWLTRNDLFLPISDASATALRQLLRIADGRIVVTGAAVDAVFETATTSSAAEPRHVLVVGGGDPRKNVECAIRAHAAASAVQSAAIPLVITGNYPPGQLNEFRSLAQGRGGNPVLLQTPGHVSEAALLDFYRHAVCVIGPSRAEGFDLPVAEGMACGVPAIASDIPAHRELVEAMAWRFDPDDDLRLAGMIDLLVRSPAARDRLIAQQAPVARRYHAAAVAQRFWEPLLARLTIGAAAPAVLYRRRPRVALLSPLPPSRSGVADYTAATCAELGKLAELHLFTTTEAPVTVEWAAMPAPLTAIPNLSGAFDAVVSVMGNFPPLHRKIFDQLLRYGGDCIAHDSRMLGFYRELGMDRATSVASQELGRAVAPAEIDHWLADEETLEAMYLGEIVSAANRTIVHSPLTARLIKERYGVAPALLPFCIYRPWDEDQLAQRSQARLRLGIPDRQILIATFGVVHRTKAPWDCVWALEMLRGWGIDASMHFIGQYAEDNGLKDTVRQLGLLDHVKFLDEHVTEATYRDYLVATDLGIQLRKTNFGSLSGALLDCIAAGVPTVTNASIAEATQPPRYIAAVPDKLSPVLVAEALANLLDSGSSRERTRSDRLAFSQAHSFRIYAAKLMDALSLEAA